MGTRTTTKASITIGRMYRMGDRLVRVRGQNSTNEAVLLSTGLAATPADAVRMSGTFRVSVLGDAGGWGPYIVGERREVYPGAVPAELLAPLRPGDGVRASLTSFRDALGGVNWRGEGRELQTILKGLLFLAIAWFALVGFAEQIGYRPDYQDGYDQGWVDACFHFVGGNGRYGGCQ